MPATETTLAVRAWHGLLILISLGLFSYAVWMIANDSLARASLLAAIGVFFMIMPKFNRIKRLKALSIEAELWEETKKEADDLIERMRDIIEIYSNEIISEKAKAGRFDSGGDWHSIWSLFDKINDQGKMLNKKIDLSPAKKVADDIFLFDMTLPLAKLVVYTIDKTKKNIEARIEMELGGPEPGNPIRDPNAYAAQRERLNAIRGKLDDEFFVIAKRGNLAREVLDLLRNAETAFRRDFELELPITDETRRRLEQISVLSDNRPVKVTPELIEWAMRKG